MGMFVFWKLKIGFCITGKKVYFLYNMENSVICLRFSWRKYRESNYQNGWYGDCMEAVWRVIIL